MENAKKRWLEWSRKNADMLLPALLDVYVAAYEQGFLDGQVQATKKETKNASDDRPEQDKR